MFTCGWLQGVSPQQWNNVKRGVTYVVELSITFNDLLTLDNAYTTLNHTLNQRIPQYYQDYNGIY